MSLRCRLVLALWATVGLANLILPPTGLRARYFSNEDRSGLPAHIQVDPSASTAQLPRAWGYMPPDVFTVTWSGYVLVSRAGDYEFTLTSDDGSTLYINRQLVVDNSGPHSARARSGRVHLEPGPQAIVLDYSQAGGSYFLEWSWALGNERSSSIPDWRLSPRPHTRGLLLAGAISGWLWPYSTIAAVLLALAHAIRRGYWPRAAPDDRRPVGAMRLLLSRQSLLGLALFALLAIVQTWPLAAAPGRLSRNDNADTVLNEWAMAWVAHELPYHPTRVFEANIFYPEHDALAYSESLLLQGAMAAPMLSLGASPVLAYNLVLLAGFALTGWAMFVTVSRWTGDWVAGATSGILVAFNAHTLTRLPHIQAQHAEFLPLALLALDQLLRKPRWSSAIWLAIAVVLQGLASFYLLVFTIVALVVAVLARPEDWWGRQVQAVALKLLGAVALIGAALLPFLVPYWRLHDRGFVRSLEEVAQFAAIGRDYLTTPSRWYPWAGGNVGLFPGTLGLVFALVALVTLVAWRDARARMCLAFGVCGVILSFGPAVVPGYERLYSSLPFLQAVRTTSRFGYLGIVAVAVLAGYGVSAIRSRLAQWTRLRIAVSSVVLALAVADPLAAPITYQPFTGINPLYRLPAATPGAVVVELPFPPPDAPFRNAPYMLNSTSNWKPLLNGYSGFLPPSYVSHFEALEHFPDARSIGELRAVGVTHLFVHFDQLEPGAEQSLAGQPGLQPLGRDGDLALYRLAP